MMYNQKMVACLKANGKILREFKDTVMIPFGSEYSIYLKNLNSVRAEVDISIDGKKVCDDGLVVNANSELNIERFIKDDLNAGNRFKFIERTGKIEKNRGVKAEDGLIRIAFKFEKVIPKPAYVWPTYGYPVYQPGHWEWKPTPSYPYWNVIWGSNAVGTANTNIRGMSAGSNSTGDNINASYTSTVSGSLQGSDAPVMNCANSVLRGAGEQVIGTASVNDIGITVPGSVSNQQFQTVSSFITEDEEHVMILRLLGETETGHVVKAPVTVKTKTKCVTCGRNNKATSSFCSECGSALSII